MMPLVAAAMATLAVAAVFTGGRLSGLWEPFGAGTQSDLADKDGSHLSTPPSLGLRRPIDLHADLHVDGLHTTPQATVHAAPAGHPLPPVPPSLGLRGPGGPSVAGPRAADSHAVAGDDPSCEGRGVFNCAGPAGTYPSTPGVMYYSEFKVPEMPKVLDPVAMTYYDYFNLWFTEQPPGGYFNQFVPQLYLGSTLSNSSNAVVEAGTAYNPRYQSLKTWHLGSMYYFAVCDKGAHGGYNCTSTTWRSRAAAGKLVPVEPGERVWTRFVLSPDWVWTLGMGVVGGGPDRESYVTVEKPFMGLLPATTSWSEARYKDTSVGGCTEDYAMRQGSIPEWEVNFTVTSITPATFWQPWGSMVEATCPWAPKGRTSSEVSQDGRIQRARWQIVQVPHAAPHAAPHAEPGGGAEGAVF